MSLPTAQLEAGVATIHDTSMGTRSCTDCVRDGLADAIINILFTVEAFFRILAIGSFFKYLNSFWNFFDFSLTAMGYLSYLNLSSSGSTGGIRALRALRALRPLRTISRFKALKAIISCFLQARPQSTLQSSPKDSRLHAHGLSPLLPVACSQQLKHQRHLG